MVKVEAGKNSGTIVDKLFSSSINVIQSTFVKSRVKKTVDTHLQRTGPLATKEFPDKLESLGLIPDRLWWGPMTLFPRKVEFLIKEIENNPPKQVLEVGAGTSTAVLAALGEKYDFQVTSLENHHGTVDYINMMLDGLECSKRLTIQHCGFVRHKYNDGKPYRWFDADLDRIKTPIDFVLVDGPMRSLVGRNGVIPEVAKYLAENHRLFLDDSKSDYSQNCIKEWKHYFEGLSVETFEECVDLALIKTNH